MFVLALAFSTYAALGILEKTCPVPSSAPPPLCSTSPTGQSENETHTNTPLLAMKYALATVSINQIVLPVSRRDVETGGRSRSFPASEVCPELSLRCWGDKTLGFFHDTHATLWVWFIQYALAASGGFCGSYSAAGAEAQTLPGLHSKHNMHGEETNIKNLFSHVKDDIVLQLLVLLHFVTWACQLGAMQGVYSKHTHRKQV